jgi:DNA gyrase/topoisomerase IV subunit A
MNTENNNEKLDDEEKFILELKADIEQAKEEFRTGNFITHEEMLIKLEKRGLIKRSDLDLYNQ